MVGRIIPVNRVAEDDESVTYAWGFPEINRSARLMKRSTTVEPGPDTTLDEAVFIRDWVHQVRQLNEMAGYPAEAPLYG